MKKTNKSGFTLVELSIVLVIIGLLIGGILVGQSLIESAKMQSFIRQIGQYDAATAVFADKFGNLPGDNALFGAVLTAATDRGNGMISDSDSAIAEFSGEIGGFWGDLGASGLKFEEGTIDNATSRSATAEVPTLNTRIPQAKVGTSAGIYAYGIGGRNYYYVAGSSAAAIFNFATTLSPLKPADALAIDSKLDNGIPNTGNVVAVTAAVTTLPAAADYTTTTTIDGAADGTSCYATVATYSASLTTDQCKLSIRMGSSTGVLN